jgi:type II secretory pathway pseudopilin PulG
MMRRKTFGSGITLLEVLLVIAILGVFGPIGFGYYRNVAKTIELDEATQTLGFNMKEARAKAMGGDLSLKWGVHFVNGAEDYYEVFSANDTFASSTVSLRIYLPSTVTFVLPSEGTNLDIVFSNIAATTTAQTVTLSNNGQTKNIYVTSQGTIQ